MSQQEQKMLTKEQGHLTEAQMGSMIDWSLAPEGYDYFIKHKKEATSPQYLDFHKQTCLGYLDLEGGCYHFPLDEGKDYLIKRPFVTNLPKVTPETYQFLSEEDNEFTPLAKDLLAMLSSEVVTPLSDNINMEMMHEAFIDALYQVDNDAREEEAVVLGSHYEVNLGTVGTLGEWLPAFAVGLSSGGFMIFQVEYEGETVFVDEDELIDIRDVQEEEVSSEDTLLAEVSAVLRSITGDEDGRFCGEAALLIELITGSVTKPISKE